MFGILIEFAAVGTIKTHHVAAVFDHRALHAEANAEEWNAAFSRELNRLHFAFDSPFAESAWDQNPVVAAQ